MKRIVLAALLLALAACSPVLNREFLDAGAREFDPAHLVETPEAFKDHLFVFGGVIVETKLTEQGSQVEGLFIPVDRYGYLQDASSYRGRFIAMLPKEKGILDPLVFKRGREISLAGDFDGVRQGKIDEMPYRYPVFTIRQAYLWEEWRNQPWPYYYPMPYYAPYPYAPSPWCSDAWGRPYHCSPFWPPPPW